MITRISKIARLPHNIRNELNTRLQNGEIGRTLLPWVNSLPETKSVMAELFAGKPITHQNLSEWRRAGYQDWLIQQQRLLWFQTLTEQETEFNRHDRSTDTFEAMSNYYIFEMGQAITSLQSIKNSAERLDRLESLTREFTRLQNAFNWSRRVHLEWNKYNDTLPAPEPQLDTQTSNLELQTGGASVPASPEQTLGALASRQRENDMMPIEPSEEKVIEIQSEPSIPEHPRTGALPDAPRTSEASDPRASVLDCGSPLSLSDSNSHPSAITSATVETPELMDSETPMSGHRLPSADFQPIPTPAPTTPPAYHPPSRNLNSQPPKPLITQIRPLRGRRFVCIEG
jgi:hypothetical protein